VTVDDIGTRVDLDEITEYGSRPGTMALIGQATIRAADAEAGAARV
jgi:hypothetical protein